jgi:excisionase family DNA binding protein
VCDLTDQLGQEDPSDAGGAPDPDALISIADAARLVGVHRITLNGRIRRGRLRATRIGRSYATTLRWLLESENAHSFGRPPHPMPEALREVVRKKPANGRRKKTP